MKTATAMVRTVRVAVPFTDGQKAALSQTADDYNHAWGEAVAWCVENKTANRTRMQKALYHPLRGKHPLMPSQFVVKVLKDAAGAVKSWNSNNPSKRWELKAARSKRTLPLDLRLMSLRGALLTVSTRVGAKRARTLIEIPAWFQNRYPDKRLVAAKLTLDGPGGLVAHLVYNLPVPPVKAGGEVVGVDRGLHKIAVTSKGGEHSGKRIRAIRRKYQHNRTTAQRKGTRSAKRRLKAMSGREKRFARDVNHQISKQMALDPDVSVYVLEDLTGLRGKTPGRDKSTRRWIGQWPFHQLAFMLEYKCQAEGKQVVYVNRAYTSQRCNRCGYTDRNNRRKGRFKCKRCGHRANADLNAARNIKDVHLLSIYAGGAGCSQPPNDG
jgi:IS605 OrfB family transposase